MWVIYSPDGAKRERFASGSSKANPFITKRSVLVDQDSIFIKMARTNPFSTHQFALHLTGTVFAIISMRLGGLLLIHSAALLNANAGSHNSRPNYSRNNHNLEPNQSSAMLSRL